MLKQHHKPALLAIFAHPDDETFRPGGTLAMLARFGVRVEVLSFTRGEAGSCGNPPLCAPIDLPAIRERELRCACTALGIQSPRLLDYSDGQLQHANQEELIAHIQAVVQQARPQVFLSFGPDGLSGHLDHIAVSQSALEAFRRESNIVALYTVALPRSLAEVLDMRQVHPVPDEMITLTVDIASVWETKLAAMRCHATQWSSSPLAFAPEERRRLFFGREYFVCAASRDTNSDLLPVILREYLL